MTPTVWTVVGQYPTGDTFVEFAAAPTPAAAGRQAVAQINARNGYDYEDTDIAMLAVFHGEQRDCLPSPRAVLGLTPTATPPANAAAQRPRLARLRARLAEMDLALTDYREGSVEYDELYAEQNEELAGELRSLLDGLLPD